MPSDPPPGADPRLARGERFRSLHHRSTPLVLPNPWDRGSARLLAGCGFEALGTTSAGEAAAAGHQDGTSTRAATLAHVGDLAAATPLPLTADLEHGFGSTPAEVAATVVAAAGAGAVGASVEDRAPRPAGGGVLDRAQAVDRLAAAAAAAHGLPFPFTLTARCDALLAGATDLGDVIARLQAFQEAGADVLYAPGLATAEAVRAVTSSVDRPVNVVLGLGGDTPTLAELAELGVARISLGSTLARVAYGALLAAASELRTSGTATFAAGAVPYATLDGLLAA